MYLQYRVNSDYIIFSIKKEYSHSNRTNNLIEKRKKNMERNINH